MIRVKNILIVFFWGIDLRKTRIWSKSIWNIMSNKTYTCSKGLAHIRHLHNQGYAMRITRDVPHNRLVKPRVHDKFSITQVESRTARDVQNNRQNAHVPSRVSNTMSGTSPHPDRIARINLYIVTRNKTAWKMMAPTLYVLGYMTFYQHEWEWRK